jgi:hypothetical protein
VAAFARDWKAARQQGQKTCGPGVFVPLAFLAGEAFQFDWSEDWATIAGERTKLQVAHVKLSFRIVTRPWRPLAVRLCFFAVDPEGTAGPKSMTRPASQE